MNTYLLAWNPKVYHWNTLENDIAVLTRQGYWNNNDVDNLVILCPNCHKMHHLDLISTETIIQMRDRPKVVKWSKRMKDAGRKAALQRKRRASARKAVASRRKNRELQESSASGASSPTPTNRFD